MAVISSQPMSDFVKAEGCLASRHAISSKPAHVSAKRVEVVNRREAVDQLHGPDRDALGHDKPRPEATDKLGRAGSRPTEHHKRRGIETLLS